MLVRGGDDHSPFDQRRDTAAPEQLCECRMGSIGEAPVGRSCGRIQNRAVFYHSGFEEIELWEDIQQLFEAASGDEYQKAAGSFQPLQRIDGGLIDGAILG